MTRYGSGSARDRVLIIDPGVALRKVTRALEIDARPKLGEPQPLETLDQVGHDQMHFKVGAGFDAQSFVMKPTKQALIASVDLGVAVERSTLGVEALDLVNLH